jgi:hypothetical protein
MLAAAHHGRNAHTLWCTLIGIGSSRNHQRRAFLFLRRTARLSCKFAGYVMHVFRTASIQNWHQAKGSTVLTQKELRARANCMASSRRRRSCLGCPVHTAPYRSHATQAITSLPSPTMAAHRRRARTWPVHSGCVPSKSCLAPAELHFSRASAAATHHPIKGNTRHCLNLES